MKKDKISIFSRNKPISDLRSKINDRQFFDNSESGSQIFATEKRTHFNWGIMFGVMFAGILIYRLFFLQIEEGLANFKIAEGNRTRNILSAAPRGMIVDESGEALVNNEAAYQLVCHFSRKKELEKVDQGVFGLIGINKDEVWEKISKSDLTGNVVLKEKIPREEALLLKKNLSSYDGFEVLPMYLRVYPYRSLSHVLGYIGKISKSEAEEQPSLLVNQVTGKSGVEQAYDQYLQGVPGSQKVEVDASGKMIRYLSESDALVGNTIVTEIDLGLQKFASETLAKTVNDLKTNGVVIAMDPRNGAIKAMVSFPDYDNTKMSSGITSDEYQALLDDKTNPLLNRAIAGEYPSGSSIKPFIAAVGLADGVVTKDTAFETPKEIKIGQWTFPDWKDHGYTDIRKAIAESNNIFFYALGGGWGPIQTGLGPERIKKGLELFSFGRKTQIDIIGERAGFLPTPEWKKKTTGENWYVGNTYNMSIGQGDLNVTPLQIANATATIANGGFLYKPHLIKKITDADGNLVKEYSSEEFLSSKDFISKENIETVREGMRQTVTSGSAKSSFSSDFPVEVAAKTGTAQFGSEGKTHAWFTSFAPYNNPELVVTVLVEGAGEGSRVSAPIARDILNWWSQNKKS